MAAYLFIASPSVGQVYIANNGVSATVPITIITPNFYVPYDGYWRLWVDGAEAISQVLGYRPG